MKTQRVKCPRCGRVWVAYEGEPDFQCNCHLYCTDGTKPSDCSVSDVTFSGDLGWPLGMHTGDPPGPKLADNDMRRRSYCSTHGKYIVEPPVLIHVDWSGFYSKRASKKLRFTRHV